MSKTRSLSWLFPLPKTHFGMLLGNGTQGLMIWGDRTLCVTVGRAGFWDRRGGRTFATNVTYAKVRRLLEADDEQGMRACFGQFDSPSSGKLTQQIGCGRLELSFPEDFVPVEGTLDLDRAIATVRLENSAGRRETVTIRQAVPEEIAWIELPASLHSHVRIETVPSWRYVEKNLAPTGVQAPELWQNATAGGFVQTLPQDEPLSLAWSLRGQTLTVATALGQNAKARAIAAAQEADVPALARRSETWWRDYWQSVPRVQLPDAQLQELYDYGVYKQAGLTPPHGVAATLQGPWMEEYQLPPWSNDYHFNINVQMIYWPALSTGKTDHFAPMWAMIHSWLPALRQNAERFFEAPDALMLPHAVDDRCQVVGTFWAGTVDHACTAWMAQMAWLHYRHAMDEQVLREIAWPLLVGAFNGYWAMLEEIEDNGRKRLSLPVSTSPEYNGSSMKAWGRDASFQLAAAHAVATLLPKAAEILGKPIDPRWQRLRNELPLYSLLPERNNPGEWEEQRPGPRISLWAGKDLDASHRHPSHLGAIYPFCTLEHADEQHRAVIEHSIDHWVRTGMGNWSGWSLAFAALIHTRVRHADAAVAMIHWWKDVFTNIGRGTLHNADFPGASRFGPWDVMQMDAGMGMVTAVSDLLVQSKDEHISILPAGIPRGWREFSFEDIATEGAFRVGATVRRGQVVEVRLTSLAGQPVSLTHGLGETWTLDGKAATGATFTTRTTAGQRMTLKRVVV